MAKKREEPDGPWRRSGSAVSVSRSRKNPDPSHKCAREMQRHVKKIIFKRIYPDLASNLEIFLENDSGEYSSAK